MSWKEGVAKQLGHDNFRYWAHTIGYNGDGHVHRDIPYDLNDPKIITKKLRLQQKVGFDGLAVTWQGKTATSCHKVSQEMCRQAGQFGMDFMLLIDPGAANRWIKVDDKTGMPPGWSLQQWIDYNTNNVIDSFLDPGTQAMLNSQAYDSSHAVLDFGTHADKSVLRAKFPGLVFCEQDVDYTWPDIPFNMSAYQARLANPRMKFPGICGQFDDGGQPLPVGVQKMADFVAAGSKRDWTKSTWGGPRRILEGKSDEFRAAQIKCIAAVASLINVFEVTWDDTDEQTAIEKNVAMEYGEDWAII